MAEVIAVLGVINSVVGIAAEGLKLSQTLNTYINNVKFAEKEIRGIARDVKHTAVVIGQLGENLKLEEKTRVCKPIFYETASQSVEACGEVFREIDATLAKYTSIGVDGNGITKAFELRDRVKFKWPFNKAHIALLRSDLDRSKALLVLMIAVMGHARDLEGRALVSGRSTFRNDDVEYEILKIKSLILEMKLKEKKYLRVKRRNDLTKLQPSSSGISRENKERSKLSHASPTLNKSADLLDIAKGQRIPARPPSEPEARSKGKLNDSMYGKRGGGKPNNFEVDECQVPGDINCPPIHLPDSPDRSMVTGAIADAQFSQPQDAADPQSKSRIAISPAKRSTSAPSSSDSKALPLGRQPVPRTTSKQHDHAKLDVPIASFCDDTSSTTSSKGSSPFKSSQNSDKLVPATATASPPSAELEAMVDFYGQETQGTSNKPVESSQSSIRASEASLEAEIPADELSGQPSDIPSDLRFHQEQAPSKDFADVDEAMDPQTNWLNRLGLRIKKMPILPKALLPGKGAVEHAELADGAKSRGNDTGTALPEITAHRTATILSEERDTFERRPTAPDIVPTQRNFPQPYLPSPRQPNQTRIIQDTRNSTMKPNYSDYGSAQPILEAWILHRSVETDTWATAARSLLPIDNSALQEVAKRFNTKGRLVWQSFVLLSSLQQRQINLLLTDKFEDDDFHKPLAWTLQALKTFPKRSKVAKIRSIQIVIEGRPCPRAYAYRQLHRFKLMPENETVKDPRMERVTESEGWDRRSIDPPRFSRNSRATRRPSSWLAYEDGRSMFPGSEEGGSVQYAQKRPREEQETRLVEGKITKDQASDNPPVFYRHHGSGSDPSRYPPDPRWSAWEPAEFDPELTIDNLLSKWTIFGARNEPVEEEE